MSVQELKKVKMPAEYTPHERTWMAWPVKDTMCHPDNYAEFCEELAHAALLIAQFEPVSMLVNENTHQEAQNILGRNVDLIEIPHNDCWLRDSGPTIVIAANGKRMGVNWQFNAWGEKYPDFTLDNQVAPRLLRHFSIPEISVPAVMEGGSFHTDGEGTLLTTEECILNKNRNPGKSREEIMNILKENLGVQRIIMLPKGLYGDETDGHIDNVACFASPGTVLLQVCNNSSDPNYQRSLEHVQILESETDATGRKLKVIPVPQPPVMKLKGKRLTLSYLNFYFVNNGIVLPIFGQSTDREVISILKTAFKGHTIVTVDGLKLVKEGGNIHCLTQQMPAEAF
ncbi:MAG: agmatine deiminase family protein [Thermoclostridium sp.]|nr:agmatine deiminase family protein [Thermoclostridium sp.]